MDISTFFYKNILDFFVTGINNNSLSGSYIISGPVGMGKRDLVKTIINKLGSSEDNILDVHFISQDDEKDEISIEQVRDLTHTLYTSSVSSNYKIVCINAAKTLTVQAGNALLKILEEPPQKTIFLLIDDNTRPMLLTIKSRSIHFNISNVMDKQLKKFLEKNNDVNDVDSVLMLAKGRPAIALKLISEPQAFDETIKLYKRTCDALLSETFSYEAYIELANPKEIKRDTPFLQKQKRVQELLETMKLILHEAIKVKTGRFSTLSLLQKENKAQSISMNVIMEKLNTIYDAKTYLNRRVPGNLVLDYILLNTKSYAIY